MKFAFVFPGQGSQSVGMLAAFVAAHEDYPAVRDTLAEASDVLHQDIAALVAEGPLDQLGLTINTQPLMLAADIAIFRAWRATGGDAPLVVAGHSLGEYAALVAAGVIDFSTALPLVRFRAEAMQEAVPVGTGTMAVILGLEDDAVRACCIESAQHEVVEAVNFNAPMQVVIAGHRGAVERACDAAKAKGAKRALILPVSAPFHSSLMKPAADRLAGHLAGVAFSTPQVDVINNIDVAMPRDAASIREALVRQAFGPVRWAETIRKMAADGVTHVVECGPGKILAGLTRRVDGNLLSSAIVDPASLLQTRELLR